MKVSISAITLAAALAIGLTSPGSAHQETAGNLKIGHPWIHEAAADAPSTYACIIEIENDGDEPENSLRCDRGRSRHRRPLSNYRKRRQI